MTRSTAPKHPPARHLLRETAVVLALCLLAVVAVLYRPGCGPRPLPAAVTDDEVAICQALCVAVWVRPWRDQGDEGISCGCKRRLPIDLKRPLVRVPPRATPVGTVRRARR